MKETEVEVPYKHLFRQDLNDFEGSINTFFDKIEMILKEAQILFSTSFK